ncbi:MAG: low molecular weight phosphotyrosine protein phosphatase [Xanthomonadales bacterium]|nr:low molecular weight phosphotyrosine protein phosphatase [Xanthomonadales bacterium]NIN60678.1 low molecular weight phosphotyrosine protein phosphatase [Xanthomonadales bacterium]NIN75539.1 low molecular weight phosphotyrosine protein phosphatase [Xanthomonadales bacterium]NIO15299.1 low molecular weight phosphotyrosine protein phosphatase [Xanthomonadales bacterium]NIP13071.1 low molecular weight phosphotyrosine protein phosphatase [Xanthomonadales bacterium]
MKNILFVCMGNICRSPTAEGFLRQQLLGIPEGGEYTVDSAGTHRYHLGCSPDPRAVEEAARFGVDISTLRARQVAPEDFQRFDLILAMDELNLSTLSRMAPASAGARLALLMDFAGMGAGQEVPDPYYGSRSDFVLMCELLDRATRAMLPLLGPESEPRD